MSEFLEPGLWVRTDIRLALSIVIALLVTGHVLLTKREVAAAAGWIGLVWFSPFLGGFTYFVLGVNRVQRRAQRMRRRRPAKGRKRREHADEGRLESNLRALSHGIGAIVRRQLLAGNSIGMLHSGDEAYPAMLAAIDGAERSIGISSYIWWNDTIGSRFIEALSRAQARGVEVRAIVDGIGSGWLRSPAYAALRAAGVPAGRFMHSTMPWRMPFLNLRTHKKILVVDGRVGFTGGVNIADQNVLANHPKEPVQDTHFRLDGPVVGQLVEAFARDWLFVSGEELDGDHWLPGLDETGPVLARVVTAGPDEDLQKVEFALLEAISCARKSIHVMTPYFLPDQQLLTALSLASLRGVAVDILVPEKNDHLMVAWAVRANIGTLLGDGARIWSSPPPFRHSKVVVVDGEWGLIGSSNWDLRSLRLNFELCVETYDADFAGELEALMLSCRGAAVDQAALDARRLPIRLRDAAVRLLLPYL